MAIFSRMLSLVALASCLVVAPLFVSARPQWGPLGHYMTGAVGQALLSPAAKNGVLNLLPETNGDMGEVASWADSVGRDMFKWSPPLHFINTPDWACQYSQPRDCAGQPGYCVDGAIQNFTQQLVSGIAPLDLNIALKFVVHFIGDIHQPLHVGFKGDLGGNSIVGTFVGEAGRKLHQVWDSDMLNKRIKDDFGGSNTSYVNYLVNQLQGQGAWASQVDAWRQCPGGDPSTIGACSQTWAEESIGLACTTAYVDENGQKIRSGFNLGEDYYNFAYPVAEEQVAKAGVRMANVMNQLFSHYTMAEYIVPVDVYAANQKLAGSKRPTMADW